MRRSALCSQLNRTFSVAAQVQQEPDKLYQYVEMEMRGNDPAVLKSFCHFATTAAGHLEIESKT